MIQADIQSIIIGKNKKIIGMMKYGLDGKIVTEFAALMTRTYAYRKTTESWKINVAKKQKSV